MIGFQENRANELMVEDGKLTGEVDGADPRPRGETRHPDRAARSRSISTTSTRWRSATAPTISA